MSITILRQSATLDGLQDQGTPARPLSQPPCQLSGIDVEFSGSGDNKSGIWQCEPGSFERQLVNAEVMHILQGACTFTPSGGKPLEIAAGDTLFFPAHTIGKWTVHTTLRKVYVVMALPG